jgi:putative membrane protein
MEKYIAAIRDFVLWFFGPTSFNGHWTDSRDWGMMGPGMMGPGMMGPGMMGWGWWGGWFGWIFMIIFWALVIVGLIFLIKWLASFSRSGVSYGKEQDSALDILKQRYAKGEINREEFDQKKKDLM